MKFAKELEREMVPEWRHKYLNYKLGKKKLNKVERAFRNVNQTPRSRRSDSAFTPSPFDAAPKYSFVNRSHGAGDTSSTREPGDLRVLAISNSQASLRGKPNRTQSSLAHQIRRSPEEEPLNGGQDARHPGMTRYGSIIGSPPKGDGTSMGRPRAPSSLKLPGAALDQESTTTTPVKKTKSVTLPPTAEPQSDNAFEVGKTKSPPSTASLPARYRSVFSPKRMNSSPQTPVVQNPRPLLRRVFSMSHKTPPSSPVDVPLEAYRELDTQQAAFFDFLDMELEKIEKFYIQKENEASRRLNVLREQLHILRDRRLDELIDRQANKIKAKAAKNADIYKPLINGQGNSDEDRPAQALNGHTMSQSWFDPVDSALEAVKAGKYGKSTKAMEDLATPSALKPLQHPGDIRDYVRRQDSHDVPYQAARRKLKVALQEYYRGLELLKSYAANNHKAFRKIVKKYDKTVNAKPSMRYMHDKVDHAWFHKSEVIDGHIRVIEDLYARYFEKGNRKVAIGKLKMKMARPGDYTDNAFRNGILLAASTVLGIQAVIQASSFLESDDSALVTNTSYLLQIYAGYFLMNTLFLLFCLACRVWHENRINYVFVFEYDTRHHLDWRQLSELPCWYMLALAIVMRLNFDRVGGESIFLYYPVILLGIATIVLFNPIKIFYYRSRMWLLYSVWRLFLAGVYPVEWRDFYTGDMFCSLTYSLGNIELFFCLYARSWNDPPMCNSSHSRLLGFFTALPGVWRALQCVRRYHDTGNAFPHLLNCGKYTATILYYMTLSLYRVDKTSPNHAAFLTFAIVNGIYCSFWDVYYDWSLGDPNYQFLRKELGYKQKWMYYTAMVIDPILRFNWIAYAIDPLQVQHSAVTSFAVGLSEVFRRAMWSLFRVENEHCTNVGRSRASRDIPLPYGVPESPELDADDQEREDRRDEEAHTDLRHASTAPPVSNILPPQPQTTTSGADLKRATSTRRRRAASQGAGVDESPLQRGLSRVGTLMRDAHAQDFERRRKPELGESAQSGRVDDDDSDDDDDDVSPGDEHSLGSASRDERVLAERERAVEREEEREEEQEASSAFRIGMGEPSEGH